MSNSKLEEEFEEVLKETEIEADWISQKLSKAGSDISNSDKRMRVINQLKQLETVAEAQEKILEHIKKGNYREAYNLFEKLVERQSEINYESTYNNLVITGIAGETEAGKILKMQEHSEHMEGDLLQRVKKASKTTHKSSYRPQVAIQENVLKQIYAEMEEITVQGDGILDFLKRLFGSNTGKEFSALMDYKRTDKGLMIGNFRLDDHEEGRSGKKVYWGDDTKQELSNSAENQVIGFHTHPRGDKGARLSPSRSDIKFKKGLKTGIAVIGYSSPSFMRPQIRKGLFAFSIREQHKGSAQDTWMYLPIKIFSGNKDVTSNHPEIQLYNNAIKKSIENNDFMLSNKERGAKLEHYMETLS